MVSGTVSFYVEYIHVLWSPLKTREESTEMEDLPNVKTPGSLSAYFSETHSISEQRVDPDQLMKLCLRSGYTVIATLAVFFPFLYPFLLLQIVNLNDSVVNILRSVTQRGSQLLLTLVFALMAIFIFTFIAYFWFYEYYSPDVGLYCDTLKDCFLSTVNLGMRSGGGIGDAFGPTLESDFGFRLIFDLLFYICITTVLMAIVFGLIVDTFSELRDERNATEFDMNNICFICGLKRSIIELKGEGWKKHTMLVHNPFSYLYFLLHLKETKELDCSGIEQFVKKCMEDKDIRFYPTTSTQIGFREVTEE
jgi:inositol 1,4,5-triphosphate receptor type 1